MKGSIAGIDIHKRMLIVAVGTISGEGEAERNRPCPLTLRTNYRISLPDFHPDLAARRAMGDSLTSRARFGRLGQAEAVLLGCLAHPEDERHDQFFNLVPHFAVNF